MMMLMKKKKKMMMMTIMMKTKKKKMKVVEVEEAAVVVVAVLSLLVSSPSLAQPLQKFIWSQTQHARTSSFVLEVTLKEVLAPLTVPLHTYTYPTL